MTSVKRAPPLLPRLAGQGAWADQLASPCPASVNIEALPSGWCPVVFPLETTPKWEPSKKDPPKSVCLLSSRATNRHCLRVGLVGRNEGWLELSAEQLLPASLQLSAGQLCAVSEGLDKGA